MNRAKEINKELVERYPFLHPTTFVYHKPIKNYDYSYTMLDEMPDGWNKAFGIQMCEEIRQVLVKYNRLDKYHVDQIKEKFGELRWYGNCKDIDEIRDIIYKYEALSRHTCQNCGAECKQTYWGGWIWTACKDCWDNYQRDYWETATDRIVPYEDVIGSED